MIDFCLQTLLTTSRISLFFFQKLFITSDSAPLCIVCKHHLICGDYAAKKIKYLFVVMFIISDNSQLFMPKTYISTGIKMLDIYTTSCGWVPWIVEQFMSRILMNNDCIDSHLVGIIGKQCGFTYSCSCLLYT